MSKIADDLGFLENPALNFQHLSEVEKLGEEILVDRQEIVALDKRRNHNREALRALKTSDSTKTWMAIGSLLIKLPKDNANNVLENDQKFVNGEINKLRSNLKVKVNMLRDLDHKLPVPGLMLKPLSHGEVTTIKRSMGVNL